MIDIVYLCVLFLVIIFFTIKIKQLKGSIDEIRNDVELKDKILWEAMETTCDHLGEEIDKIKTVKKSGGDDTM